MTIEEIGEWLKIAGEPPYRAEQIFTWLHSGVEKFDEMSNLPKKLRENLCNNFHIADVKIKKRLESTIDNTVKYLYELYDGEFIESVLMNYHHGYSVCISTQVGCRMGCKFCASGLEGFFRNLTASEMLAQVKMAEKDNGIRVSNVVMMGMGEPLDNYDNSVRFLRLVSHEKGMNIGLRHISLSTSGVVPGIYKLMNESLPITLSISLHAPNNEVRSKIMPVNRKWNIEELLKACRDYIDKTGRRISFEYAVIDGVNDTDENAKELASKLKGMLCHLNLIPANPVAENNFKSPDKAGIQNFCNSMIKYGINTTVRRTLGADINASCGQLRRSETLR
ncbi:MAG: 23S rRNA (adenine(2503)-C(2))-methyltransferase RlmN [Oscillospiraceae bacterium]|nr:23S rRNA (adenine(2503)-C(2))-methyltransferase RlmN [Oscillospiraceae bacterium]